MKTLLDAIYKIQSREELKHLSAAIHERHQTLNTQAARTWSVGDLVEFDGRNGRSQGQIIKVNRLRVKVSTLLGTWNVPASMLRSALSPCGCLTHFS